MTSPSPVVRHVLFDADGVLQLLPGGWYDAMRPFVGARVEEFLHATWSDELPALRGEGDYLVDLARALREWGVPDPVEEVFAAVWHSIETVPESFALVQRLRDAGYGVHLATNQEQHRAAYMKGPLGYDDLFDVSCYSCDLKAAKPDPEFFRRAAALVGAEPGNILFVDDNADNVAGARSVGMAGVHWDLGRGHDELVTALASYGVTVGGG